MTLPTATHIAIKAPNLQLAHLGAGFGELASGEVGPMLQSLIKMAHNGDRSVQAFFTPLAAVSMCGPSPGVAWWK